MKYTRQDYMDGKCTHDEYYGQFVTDTIRGLVLRNIGDRKYLSAALKKDKNLNNIPLGKWDAISEAQKGLFVIDKGWSLSNGVCILKAAAKQIIRGE